MGTWILIIMLHGWGGGVGSTGNAATAIEFNSEQNCKEAKTKVQTQLEQHTESPESFELICTLK